MKYQSIQTIFKGGSSDLNIGYHSRPMSYLSPIITGHGQPTKTTFTDTHTQLICAFHSTFEQRLPTQFTDHSPVE